MDKNQKATEASAPTIAPEKVEKVLTTTEEDLEAKNLALEAEKFRLIEESANYKLAYLKEKKKKEQFNEENETESLDEEKIREITRVELANSRIAEIAREQDLIIKKALKENKELKLAQLNRTTIPPASVGTHSEGTPVTSTLVTPDQMSAFKAKGWSDKDIERYKRNLQKYSGR